VFWAIAGALVVIAWQQVRSPAGGPTGLAMAQPTAGSGLRGVYSFAAELGRERYGVYMVDVDTMTIWCYEYARDEGCLKLAAARSWKYDRYLENFNGCGIPPDKVKELLEDQRAYRSESVPAP